MKQRDFADSTIKEAVDGLMEQFRKVRDCPTAEREEERKQSDALANAAGKVFKGYMIDITIEQLAKTKPPALEGPTA